MTREFNPKIIRVHFLSRHSFSNSGRRAVVFFPAQRYSMPCIWPVCRSGVISPQRIPVGIPSSKVAYATPTLRSIRSDQFSIKYLGFGTSARSGTRVQSCSKAPENSDTVSLLTVTYVFTSVHMAICAGYRNVEASLTVTPWSSPKVSRAPRGVMFGPTDKTVSGVAPESCVA